MLRSVFSVVGGFGLWTALWLGGSAVARSAMPDAFREDGSTDHVGILCAMLAFSVICSIIAGNMTGVIARRNAMAHGAVFGIILLAVGISAQAQYWDKLPIWYHLSFLAMLIPGVMLGVKLHLARQSAGTPALAV